MGEQLKSSHQNTTKYRILNNVYNLLFWEKILLSKPSKHNRTTNHSHVCEVLDVVHVLNFGTLHQGGKHVRAVRDHAVLDVLSLAQAQQSGLE